MRVHHLALRTRDLGRLIAFYSSVLGLPVTKRAPGSAWLDAEGTIVMIERASEGEPEIPAGSMEILVFEVGPDARDAMVSRLASRGIPLEAESEYTVYFRDPDGRRVGLSHYPADRTTAPAPESPDARARP